jgi:GTPase SAR1 family protein
MSVGTKSAEVQLWDVAQHKKLRTMRGHTQRGTSSIFMQR